MKNILWIVVAAVIAGGGYMLYSGSSPKKLINTATDAVNAPAAKVAEEAAAAAEAAAAKVVEEAAAAATETASGGMADLLSVDGFNLDKVSEMIDGSEIGAFQKTALKTALEKAQDNPEALQTVLDKIKEAAGL